MKVKSWNIPGDWLICPDTHWAPKDCPNGGVDPHAESLLLQAIDVVKPVGFLHLGDAGEWEAVSPWRWKRRKRPPLTFVLEHLKKDAVAVNAGLDRIDKQLASVGTKHKIMCAGNHEVWVHNLIEETPQLASEWSVPALLRLAERSYSYIPYGEYIRIGKLAAYHGGHFSSGHHTQKHLVNIGASVVYGHLHSAEYSRSTSLQNGPHGAWCIGSIARIDKAFLKGRPVNWSPAFAVVHVAKGGDFWFELIDIYKKSCWVYGKKLMA